MARTLSAGNSLAHAAAVLTAVPLTMACWVNITSLAALANFIVLDNGSASDRIRLYVNTDGTINAQTVQGGSASTATTSTTTGTGVWVHACGVWAAADSRVAYLNAGGKVTQTTARTPAGINASRLGVGSGAGSPLPGVLAEPVIWNVALSDADVAALATGMSPLLMRPDGLVAYWPLIGRYSPEIDRVGGFAMTVTGTAAASPHPRVYYPRQQRTMSLPAAPPPPPPPPPATGSAGGMLLQLGSLMTRG